MNKITIKSFLLIVFLFPAILFAQIAHGIIRESLTLESKILHHPVHYTIYLPFDYFTSERTYPVVYLLHGYGDNDKGWMQYGEAGHIADEEIAEGKIPPMVLVTPDAGNSWYLNNYNDCVRYEDFFFKEFIPFIESHYHIRKGKAFRAVAGLSMGGYGALVYAMKYPEDFAACAVLSAAVRTDKQYLALSPKRWEKVEAVVFGPGLKGKQRLTALLVQNNPLHLVQTESPGALRKVKFYIDCGDHDHLTIGNATLHILMTQHHIPHEFIMRPGKHSWSYWRSGLPGALEFIGRAFIH